ncbi:MAG: AAA family ATPase [Clostridia bacterium]|nr:AAA family ATPase [Clostridia bacterium]
MADKPEVRALQNEFLAAMKLAEEDRRQNGDYTKAGLVHLVKAAMFQNQLSKITEGPEQAEHKSTCNVLLVKLQQHMRRLGMVAQPAPVPQPLQPRPVAPVQPAAPDQPNTGKAAPANDELKGFDVNEYIIKPGRVSLDSAKDSFPDVVEALQTIIDYGRKMKLFPKLATGKGKRNDNCLFYGPPGTGKSHICAGLATYLAEMFPDQKTAFFLIDSSIASKYKGVAENRIKAIFEAADTYDRAIVCVDEVEKLCPDRDSEQSTQSYTSTFLERIEGVDESTKAMVIIATNYPHLVDPAIISRMGRKFFIDYPAKAAYVSYLRKQSNIADALGETEEQREKMIDLLANEAVERKFSFRVLQAMCTSIFDVMLNKTTEAFPDGSDTLTNFLALPEETLLAIANNTGSDYDPEGYQKLLDYKNTH